MSGPLAIDLETVDLGAFPITVKLEFDITTRSRIDGVGIWFDAGVDNEPLLGNGPRWQQKPWPMAIERIEPLTANPKDQVTIEASVSAISIDLIRLQLSSVVQN